jgi:uncharacterized membrane protein
VWAAIFWILVFICGCVFVILMMLSAHVAEVEDKETTQKRNEELSQFERLARERLKRETQNETIGDGSEG